MTDELRKLVGKWRAQARFFRDRAALLHPFDDPERQPLTDAAIHHEEHADELEAALTGPLAQEQTDRLMDAVRRHGNEHTNSQILTMLAAAPPPTGVE